MDVIAKKIQVEKDALIAFGIIHDDAEAEIFKTRTCIDAKVNELELELNEAANKNDFKRAREIDAELLRLMELKVLRPSKQKLIELMSQLESELAVAKANRDWDAAEKLFVRLEEIRAKLMLEDKAEIDTWHDYARRRGYSRSG